MTATRTPAQRKASEKNLVNFSKGDKRAVEAGRKGGKARAARAAGREVDTAKLGEQLVKLQSEFKREALGETAAALAIAMMVRVELGEIEVTGRDVPDLLRVLVDIARLEAGEATSQTIVGHVSSNDAMTRLKELRGTDVDAVIEIGDGE